MSLKMTVRWATLAAVLALTACAQPLPVPTSSSTAPASAGGNVASPSPAGPVETLPPLLSPTPEPPLAARVNGQPIYLDDYERILGQYEASLAAQGIDVNSTEGQQLLFQQREWILSVMIEQLLIEQDAAAAGVTVSDEEVETYLQAMIAEHGGEEAFDARLASIGETRQDARRQVRAGLIGEKMRERIVSNLPTTAEYVHARHILVSTQEEAERILAQLQASADFVTLAQAYSQDATTRENGGDLGFFTRGTLLVPEVEEVAFALQPGQFSRVIPSALGYHIVQVIERDPARTLSPDDLLALQEREVQRWLEGLWARADVQRFVGTTP